MEDERVWITFKYERLPTVCYVCGRMGHDNRHCMQATNGKETEYQYGEWLKASGSFNGTQYKVKTKRNDNAVSSGGSEEMRQPPSTAVMGDTATDSGGGVQKSGGFQESGKDGDWVTRGDDGRSACQAACLSQRWDKAEETLHSLGKGDVAREQGEVQNTAKAKGKNKICEDQTSIVGLQKGRKKGEESEVTSPLKPKGDKSEEAVVGYMDVGQSEERKPNARGSWKKLARAQGLTDSNAVAQKEEEVGTKRPRKTEKQGAEEVRKNKKKREEAPDSDLLMTTETAVTARQHHREP